MQALRYPETYQLSNNVSMRQRSGITFSPQREAGEIWDFIYFCVLWQHIWPKRNGVGYLEQCVSNSDAYTDHLKI